MTAWVDGVDHFSLVVAWDGLDRCPVAMSKRVLKRQPLLELFRRGLNVFIVVVSQSALGEPSTSLAWEHSQGM